MFTRFSHFKLSRLTTLNHEIHHQSCRMIIANQHHQLRSTNIINKHYIASLSHRAGAPNQNHLHKDPKRCLYQVRGNEFNQTGPAGRLQKQEKGIMKGILLFVIGLIGLRTVLVVNFQDRNV
eukprot:451886_1